MSEPFRHQLRVRYNECDPQGVVFNANYLTYFDLTMTELWRELGGYQAMVDAGVDMVVAEARILYRSPLRFDDDFEAQVEIERLGETSMSAEILLARDGEPVAEGELRYVFVESGGGATRRFRSQSGTGSPLTPEPDGVGVVDRRRPDVRVAERRVTDIQRCRRISRVAIDRVLPELR